MSRRRIVAGRGAAVRIDAGERDGNVRVRAREVRDLVVRELRAARQAFIDGEDDEGHAARSVVLGEPVRVARRAALAEVLPRGTIGAGVVVGRVEVHMHVYSGDFTDPNGWYGCHASAVLWITSISLAPPAAYRLSPNSRAAFRESLG